MTSYLYEGNRSPYYQPKEDQQCSRYLHMTCCLISLSPIILSLLVGMSKRERDWLQWDQRLNVPSEAILLKPKKRISESEPK